MAHHQARFWSLLLAALALGCSQADPPSLDPPPDIPLEPPPALEAGPFTAGAWLKDGPRPSPDCRFPQKFSDDIAVYAVFGTCPPPGTPPRPVAGRTPAWTPARPQALGIRGEALEVLVNRPEEPTALILAAGGSCHWRVAWTEGSKIEAVVLVGDGPQFVSGLLTDSPLLASLDGRPCGVPPDPDAAKPEDSIWLPAEPGPPAGTAEGLELLSLKLFERPLAEAPAEIEAPGQGRNGGWAEAHPVVIGPPLALGDRYYSLHDYLYQPSWSQLMNLAEKQGLIRPAVAEDFSLWRQAAYEAEKQAALAEGLPAHLIPEFNEAKLWGSGHPGGLNYVILDPRFEIPAGTTGCNFFVPAELPLPRNLDIRNRLYLLKDGSSCSGSDCR